jgi:hypothetical protein
MEFPGPMNVILPGPQEVSGTSISAFMFCCGGRGKLAGEIVIVLGDALLVHVRELLLEVFFNVTSQDQPLPLE